MYEGKKLKCFPKVPCPLFYPGNQPSLGHESSSAFLLDTMHVDLFDFLKNIYFCSLSRSEGSYMESFSFGLWDCFHQINWTPLHWAQNLCFLSSSGFPNTLLFSENKNHQGFLHPWIGLARVRAVGWGAGGTGSIPGCEPWNAFW